MDYRALLTPGFFFKSNLTFTPVEQITQILLDMPGIELESQDIIVPDGTEVFTLKSFYHCQPCSNHLDVVLRHRNGYRPSPWLLASGGNFRQQIENV